MSARNVTAVFRRKFSQGPCNGCDNCLEPRETFDGTIAAQKFLSCVHRVEAKQGFGFGLNHIVEVLIGGTNEAIEKRGHNQLSTFGIGKDLPREQWQRIGRELLRLGLVEAAPGKFATLSVTDAGMMALRKRTPITLTKPFEAPAKKVRVPRAGEIECDEELFERLRALRRRIADERDVPAYIIFPMQHYARWPVRVRKTKMSSRKSAVWDNRS